MIWNRRNDLVAIERNEHLEKNPDNWMYYFGDFELYTFSRFPFSFWYPHYFFSDKIPHCYKIANTPILQSRNPLCRFQALYWRHN